jgi:hypothetical protein
MSARLSHLPGAERGGFMVSVIGFKGWDQEKGRMMPSRLKATRGALDRNRSAQPIAGSEEEVPDSEIKAGGSYDPGPEARPSPAAKRRPNGLFSAEV